MAALFLPSLMRQSGSTHGRVCAPFERGLLTNRTTNRAKSCCERIFYSSPVHDASSARLPFIETQGEKECGEKEQ